MVTAVPDWIEEPWAEGTGSVAADEEVDVSHMVGLEHDRDRGRMAVEA
jgi:hypothetical protein